MSLSPLSEGYLQGIGYRNYQTAEMFGLPNDYAAAPLFSYYATDAFVILNADWRGQAAQRVLAIRDAIPDRLFDLTNSMRREIGLNEFEVLAKPPEQRSGSNPLLDGYPISVDAAIRLVIKNGGVWSTPLAGFDAEYVWIENASSGINIECTALNGRVRVRNALATGKKFTERVVIYTHMRLRRRLAQLVAEHRAGKDIREQNVKSQKRQEADAFYAKYANLPHGVASAMESDFKRIAEAFATLSWGGSWGDVAGKKTVL